MKVTKLQCEAMNHPIGLSVSNPRLSWQLETDKRGDGQKAFQIWVYEEVIDSPVNMLIFYSGTLEAEEHFLVLDEVILNSGCRYLWKVVVTDKGGTAWESEEAYFEMGLLKETDWKAKWIEPVQEPAVKAANTITQGHPNQQMDIPLDELRPCPMIRKVFSADKPILRARLYVTAHGIYRAWLNGMRAGDYEFSPEATCYDDYLQVQTYDVTDMMVKGENALGIELADGWWAGHIGNFGDSVQYGDKLALLAQLQIRYTDGSEEIIASDESFCSFEGPRRYADLCIGEKYDMNLEIPKWAEAGAYIEGTPVKIRDYGYRNLTGQNAPHIKVLETKNLVRTYISPKGERILDFGQLMAGNASLTLIGQPHAAVTLQYFEETDQEGNYWFELGGRNSQQTDTVILDENGKGIYDPCFTYHAYRYIWLSSDRGEVREENAKARLIASDVEVSTQIVTSDKRVNRLQKNIEWTLRSNMFSILTDNPDRERAGWTGDGEMVMPAVCSNLDVQTVMRRWLLEAGFEQDEDGKVPLVVPNWETYANMRMKTSAGWEDAVVIIPWILYERYGDIRVLEESYPMMKKWVSYQRKRAGSTNPRDCGELTKEQAENYRYLDNGAFNFGDWLTPSACYNKETGEYTYFTQTLTYMMGSYYFAYTTSIMARAAKVLGKTDEAKEYGDLNKRICRAAVDELYKKGKILESPYMGAQILALHAGFYPQKDKQKLVNRMLTLIREKGMDCGFSSALLLFDTLCAYGREDIAYQFLLSEEFPSWLYEVNQGATTVWESMQAIMPDGTRNAVSFIQPCFCSIGNWMLSGMAGIRPAAPGYREIVIHPYLTDRLDFAEAVYRSAQGEIRSRWERDTHHTVHLKIQIPANARAYVFLEKAVPETVTEGGIQVEQSEGITHVQREKKGVSLTVGSGKYHFTWKLQG